MDKMHLAKAEDLSDREIIERVLQGEKNYYEQLVRKYNQRLYRVCMSIINNDQDAEDVMQIAYLNAYENLARFEFRSSFSTWLTRILINECLLYKRKKKSSLPMNEERNNMEMPTIKNPLAMAVNSELKKILEKAICQLPEKYRTVFVMREMEDMNVADTKECLGISEANVKVRLNRAKSLLRNSLNELYTKEELLPFHLTRCDRLTNSVMQNIAGYSH